jgi:hypothetical protein
MPVVVCPTCDRKLQLPDDTLVQEARCPLCGAAFVAESDGLVRAVTVRPLADAAPPAPAPAGSTAPRPDQRQGPAPTVRGDPGRRLTTGRLVVLILACLGLLAAVGFVGFVVYRKAGHTTKELIVGKWRVVEDMNGPVASELTYEFAPNGKLRITFMGAVTSGTYRVARETLDICIPEGANSPVNYRIEVLSETELVIGSPLLWERTKLRRLPN